MRLHLQYFGGRGASGVKNSFSNSIVKEVVYHGTNIKDIDQFKTDGRESNGAIFFASDADYAEEEAYIKSERGGESTLYEVNLNIKNPLYVTLEGANFGDPVKERKYVAEAKAQGKDAVIFDNGETDEYLKQTFYAVFDPKQIKVKNRKRV